MPVSSKKELYLAKSMGELNKMAELPDKFKNTNAKLLVKTSEKMLKEAEHSDMITDEERAYVLYMKYFNVVTFLKKTADYKKQKKYYDDLLGAKNLLKAIDKAEELAGSLRERYDLKEAEMVANKLASLDREADVVEKTEVTPETDVTEKHVVKSAVTAPVEDAGTPSSSISCTQLYHLLQDRNTHLLVMDVRPVNDFQLSSIGHDSVINVPPSTLPAGTTVTYIEKALPAESVSLWRQRANVDHIIVLDGKSRLQDVRIGSPLQTLKDALFKYDSTTIVKSEPLVLEGGYESFVLHYPTLCINPDLERVSRPAVTSTLESLMDFDYPDFDEVVKPDEPVKPSPVDISSFQGNQINGGITKVPMINGNLPRVDRSTKPSVDRSTKVNVTRIDVKASTTTTSLYPDVKAMTTQFPANQKPPQAAGANQNQTGSISATKNQKVSISTNRNQAMVEMDSIDSSNLNKQRKTDPVDLSTGISSDLSRELENLEKMRQQKQAELDKMQEDHERIRREGVARMERMKQEEQRLTELEELRRKQQQDVADLLRMKKSLQQNMVDEMKETDREKKREEEEQLKRQQELLVIAKEEEEKKRRQDEVSRLRIDRKLREEEKEKEIEKQQKELQESVVRARQAEEQRQRDLAAAEEAAAQQTDAEVERKKKEEEEKMKEKTAIEERLRLEKENQARLEKERLAAFEEKRRIQAEIDKKEREKQEILHMERERIERERLEKERKDREEEDRKRALEAKRVADEKLRLLVESRSKPKIVPSPNLSSGWEKQLDPRTNRYFYINHTNNTTQWEPPNQLPGAHSASGGTYTARLKEEPVEKRRGLSRSNSSPNIAQMVDDESKWAKNTPTPTPMPSVDRNSKPKKPEIQQPIQMPVKRRDLNPVYGNVGRALTGLRNLGNTCYMNSTLQCLNNTSPLVTYLLTNMYLYDINRENILGDGGELADDFAYVVKALWSGQYRFISPRDFKHVVGKYQPMFAGYDQQDCQEFLTFLLDGLHEGLNKVKTRPKIPEQENDGMPDLRSAELAWKNHKLQNESIIVELFQGQLKSTLQCLTCGKQSVNFQAFMFLSLPIPSSTRCSLEDCLKQFSCPEKMTGSSRWHCPRCKCLRDSVKKIDIWKLPRILFIALNRFVYDGQWRTKINTSVEFPTRSLDLTNYVRGPTCKPYNLYAVSNHFGSLDLGHYTASCKNPCNQKWYKYDDQEVSEISVSSINTSAAYVLYYTSIELPPPDFKPNF